VSYIVSGGSLNSTHSLSGFRFWAILSMPMSVYMEYHLSQFFETFGALNTAEPGESSTGD